MYCRESTTTSGHKISVKRRGSATGACARSRGFNYAVLPKEKFDRVDHSWSIFAAERRMGAGTYAKQGGENVAAEISIAGLSLLGTLAGTAGGIIVSGKLVNYRIEQLEKEGRKAQ